MKPVDAHHVPQGPHEHIKSRDSGGDQSTFTSVVRCMGSYQVSDSIWLTPVWLSDASELFRVLNIDRSISEGLHSTSMTFPFPEAGAVSFTERHQQRRSRNGRVTSWAIRRTVSGPMIGLFALDPFDHGDDYGPCFRDTIQTEVDTEICSGNTRTFGDRAVLRCGGLGYWISPEHAGLGIMGAVVAYGLRQLARAELGYERVHGEAWVENQASRTVMERAGMRPSVGMPCFVPKFNTTKQVAHYVVDV